MQVVVRALNVLKAVVTARTPPSLADLSESLEMPPPTVHRFLAVLTEQGYVDRDGQTRRYLPGPEVLELLSLHRPPRLAEVAQAALDRLHERFGETVFVGALAVDRAVCVALAESGRPLRLNVSIGDHLPWHAAASARAILAHLSEPLVTELLRSHRLDRFTENTPQDLEAIYQHLDHVRVHGYDVCDDELDSGVWAAAAPIVDANGSVHGSLTLGAPAERLRSDEARAEVIGAVMSGAGGIAKLLMAR